MLRAFHQGRTVRPGGVGGLGSNRSKSLDSSQKRALTIPAATSSRDTEPLKPSLWYPFFDQGLKLSGAIVDKVDMHCHCSPSPEIYSVSNCTLLQRADVPFLAACLLACLFVCLFVCDIVAKALVSHLQKCR